MVMDAVTLSDVEEWRTRERPVVAQGAIVWGPVQASTAAQAGCSRGVESVCIKPAIAPIVVMAALDCVPVDVRATISINLSRRRAPCGAGARER